MNFPEIDKAIELCKINIKKIKEIEPELESYLTSYLLMYIYARFECKLKGIIKSSFHKYTNASQLHNYLSYCTERIIRSININTYNLGV